MALKEAKVEGELYYLIKTILKKHKYKFYDVKFGDIERQHNVDGGIADLVLPFSNRKHCLVIECKRKIIKPSGFRAIRDFDVFGSRVLNQALNYAVRLGSPAFATTNGARLALFRTPEAGEPFRIDTHRLLVQDPFRLEEKNVEKLLDFLAKWHAGIPVRLVEIDWFFISRLRSFVDFLSRSLKPTVKKLQSDKTFSKKLEEFSKRIGLGITTEQLARETAYLLMNKIVFYKILERHYEDLPKLEFISAPDGKYFIEFLKGYFTKAIEVTGDFEPIFITELYDDVPLPNLDYVFEEVNSFIEDMSIHKLEEVGSDVVGYIYEELIPDEERHRLGQFYTPPPIAELIVKWAIESHNDVILDPAVGSGTFLVKAYQRLIELKSKHYRKAKQRKYSKNIHKEILSQLYADDINPFPAHLTSMNLAMRDVRYPTSEMNVIIEDFFSLRSRMDVLAPYVVKTPRGEIKRHINIPTFDIVVANPPYTRWVEIPEKTQKSINRSIGSLLKKYKLSRGIRREIGIYVHFIMHAYDFLKKNGRLGMIISNSWLQTNYGVNFANFLLDHFKAKAVIDFNHRLFRIPLIATCVILLEKEKSEKDRSKNKTVFIYVDKEAKVEEILDALENPEGWKDKFLINVVRQGDIPRDENWLKIMFNTKPIEEAIHHSPITIKAERLFEPRYGNVSGVSTRGGTGCDAFFYLTADKAEKRGLIPDFVCPTIVSPRYAKYFTFSRKDWNKLAKEGKRCYTFIAHKPRSKLPKSVQDYIKWGETTRLVKPKKKGAKPKTANKSLASTRRAKERASFYGWYDLGEFIPAKISVVRRAWRKARFVLTEFPCGLDEGAFISFVPRRGIRFTKKQMKALLAYLNSTLAQFLVETLGITAGGGASGLDVKTAKEFPILNVIKLKKKKVSRLAELFDKLEFKSREIGGVLKEEDIENLQPVITEIDKEICKILKLSKKTMVTLGNRVSALVDRRIARAGKARPESVKGEEEPKIKPPKKRRRKQKEEFHRLLTKWME